MHKAHYSSFGRSGTSGACLVGNSGTFLFGDHISRIKKISATIKIKRHIVILKKILTVIIEMNTQKNFSNKNQTTLSIEGATLSTKIFRNNRMGNM